MIRFLAIMLALAAGAGTAAAQGRAQTNPPSGQNQQQRWLTSDSRTAFVPARIAFPLQAGVMTARRTQEFSHQGEGLDNALQYASGDNAVVGTVYVYYPGLPHGGLAAFMTDYFIRNSQPATQIVTPMRLVAAGGVQDIAIRIDYGNYRGMASSAAFIKAGRWIVKLRVSGPEARRAEVEAGMAALLQQIEFGRANPPMAPHMLEVTDCPADAGQTAAQLLPDPPGAEIAAHGLLATFDGGGIEATGEEGNRRDLPPRIPDRLCLTRMGFGQNILAVLRGEPGDALSIDGRTMLIVLLNDAGAALEVIQARNLERHVMLHHQIGGTDLLGGYDGVPSDTQLIEILLGTNREGTRIRVPVRLRPDRGPEIILPSVSTADARTGAAPTRGSAQ